MTRRGAWELEQSKYHPVKGQEGGSRGLQVSQPHLNLRSGKSITTQAGLVLTWIISVWITRCLGDLGHCQSNFIKSLYRMILFSVWTVSAGNTCPSLSTWMNILDYLRRRHPRGWCGRKASFQIIQWLNYVTLACKTVSLQQNTWKKEGGVQRCTGKRAQHGSVLQTISSNHSGEMPSNSLTARQLSLLPTLTNYYFLCIYAFILKYCICLFTNSSQWEKMVARWTNTPHLVLCTEHHELSSLDCLKCREISRNLWQQSFTRKVWDLGIGFLLIIV